MLLCWLYANVYLTQTTNKRVNSMTELDLECPKTDKQLLSQFVKSESFERDFMEWIDRGRTDGELYTKELEKVANRHKGEYFISPIGNYIVSLGSRWEGLNYGKNWGIIK